MKTLPIILFLLFWHMSAGAQTITTIAGNGTYGYSGDGGPATDAQIKGSLFVAFDKYGNLYIPETHSNVVRKVNTAGIISTVAGTNIAGYAGDGGLATNAAIRGPSGVLIDDNDNIFIADCNNHVIRKINSAGIISTIAGTGVSGHSGDGGPASSAKLKRPYALTFDNVGNIYFSDAGSCVVRKISSSGIITTVAGCGICGDSGEGGPATDAKMYYVGHLAFHPKTGELYIPDHYSSKVRKIKSDGTLIIVAGNGTPGNDGDGGPASSAKMQNPNAVCFDTSGNLFISDVGAHVIRKVDANGIISTIAGTGISGFNGDGNLATLTQINSPNCGNFDKWGNLHFTDYSGRIRRINYNPILSINETITPSPITLSPNPATNQITISSTTIIQTLHITNILGQLVLTHTPNKKEATINIPHLPPGTYLAKINSTHTSRFVKE